MKDFLDPILNIPVSDPDDARRRRVLNIFLLGTIVATIILFLAVVIDAIINKKLADS
ncbi:MAG: hypothetical protein MZV64_19380 [Ignavibacteriales bacterium]|nr:hypothetical protein [Ignavibacteriales bacterium]